MQIYKYCSLSLLTLQQSLSPRVYNPSILCSTKTHSDLRKSTNLLLLFSHRLVLSSYRQIYKLSTQSFFLKIHKLSTRFFWLVAIKNQQGSPQISLNLYQNQHLLQQSSLERCSLLPSYRRSKRIRVCLLETSLTYFLSLRACLRASLVLNNSASRA